jgi:hypothetical protein
MFPTTPHFLIPFCLAMVLLPNVLTKAVKVGAKGFGFYVGECPMFQKYWRWPNEMSPSGPKRRKEKPVAAPLTI